MAKMNPEIKARWVTALRSGEYKQAHGRLERDGGFCCLGVLCDLHSKESGRPWEAEYKDSDRRTYMGSGAILPKAVILWSGLTAEWGAKVVIGNHEMAVTEHNDGQGVPQRTFAEIADAIEAQL